MISKENFSDQVLKFLSKYILDFKWEAAPPKINLTPINLASTEDGDDDILDNVSGGNDLRADQVNLDEDYDAVVQDRAFLDNLNDFMEITRDGVEESTTGMVETQDPNTPRGFLSFLRDGVSYYVRKSTILWSLSSKSSKLSTDRLQRFINSNRQTSEEEAIQLGDFIVMLVGDEETICQVLGFKYLHEKFAFKAISCPVKHEGGSGVAVLINQFQQHDNGDITIQKKRDCYINIENYVRHITLNRNNKTDRYTLGEKRLQCVSTDRCFSFFKLVPLEKTC